MKKFQMQKAFIFDLDGVMINNETMWEEKGKKEVYLKIFGPDIAGKIGTTTGISMYGIYDKAIGLGAKPSKEEYTKAMYEVASHVYRESPLTPGTSQLVDKLTELQFVIGVVSLSPKEWIDIVVSRLSLQSKIQFILSLHNRKDLRTKPFPDGYIEAMKQLHASPQTTIILEDSNPGIASAKASGAYTIGFKQNLILGATQTGADIYANNMHDVINIVANML